MSSIKFATIMAAYFLIAPLAARADTAGTGQSKLAAIQDGSLIYRHVCQSCHMEGAVGAKGAGAKIPALAGNAKLSSDTYLAYVVVHGFAGMPALGGMLNDQQIAAVSNYVRTHFGNAYSANAADKLVGGLR